MDHRLKHEACYKLLRGNTDPLSELGLGKDFVHNYTENGKLKN